MRKRGNQLSFDSRDLMRSQCQHCTNLALAREFDVPGVRELVTQYYEQPDNLAIRYGMKFETLLEQELIANLGDLVAAPVDRSLEATLDLMAQGVPVIYQGTLFGGSGEHAFSGRPDFLIRGEYQLSFSESGLTALQLGSSEGYTAWDAKLSTTAKQDYQNQVGLYVDVLRELGLAANAEHGLILGNRSLIGFGWDVVISGMLPVRDQLFDQIAQFQELAPQRLEDIGELLCEASSYCDLCEYPLLCEFQRHETSHLQLVAGITRPQILSLNRSGIKTVRELSHFHGETDKLSVEQVEKLSRQARLQLSQYETGKPSFEVIAPVRLPEPGEGDIFFDIEGFTFFDEPGGLEYLFGWTDSQGAFHYLWADDRAQERELFIAFMQELLRRQSQYPEFKVYHYANYEQTALKKLAARHGVYESEVLGLLDAGVFIDLYKTVKASLVISQESYSIKKLENYYSFARASDVKEAMGSMEYFDQYLSLTDPDEREKLKRQVITYNQDDCVSTLALYKWLRALS